MLTPEQLLQFESRGLIKLQSAVAPRVVERIASGIWDLLGARFGVDRQSREAWSQHPIRAKTFRSLQQADAWAGMASPVLRSVADQLLGEGQWIEPLHWGQPLVNFPDQEDKGRSWCVPHNSWHVDLAARCDDGRAPGLQVFLLVEPLLSQSGATIAACGSQYFAAASLDRLEETARGHSGTVRNSLEESVPWFHDLCGAEESSSERIDRFIARETVHEGKVLQVEELTGAPGDVWVMHPHVFHNASRNCSGTPRMVLTERLWRLDAMRGFWRTSG